jgi:hypothetical protein
MISYLNKIGMKIKNFFSNYMYKMKEMMTPLCLTIILKCIFYFSLLK